MHFISFFVQLCFCFYIYILPERHNTPFRTATAAFCKRKGEGTVYLRLFYWKLFCDHTMRFLFRSTTVAMPRTENSIMVKKIAISESPVGGLISSSAS